MGEDGGTTTVLADDATAVGRGRATSAEPPDVPRRLGRFEIRSVLGTGGMGIVYLAHDPDLDRLVAVKVLRFDGGLERPCDARLRLLREARAMAKLNHPNVVPVYAVETLDPGPDGAPRLFVAMQYVSGFDLRQWLRQAPRPWQEIVGVFVDAARGLAAAHRAGIIHRDFKPGNVLVGSDGAVIRARVADFGIARAVLRSGALPGATDSLESFAESTEGEDEMLSLDLTQRGTVMGTPWYMAPEQHLGDATPRSDQYAVCVALWEALYRERPFDGKSPRALVRLKRAQRWRVPPRRPRLPRRLQACMERGLAADPDQRWPDMDALADELERMLQRPGKKVASLVAVVGAAGIAMAMYPSEDPACADPDAALSAAWDPPTRQGALDALGRLDAPYASHVEQQIQRRLDGYAERWLQARVTVCAAAGHIAPTAFDARMLCLDDRRRALRALTEVFSDADEEVLRAAVDASEQLPPIGACLHLDGSNSPLASEPPAARPLRDKLARADALHHASKHAEALELLREVVGDTQTIEAPLLRITAQVNLGRTLDSAGRYDEAERVLSEAFFEAQQRGLDELAARAATKLIWVTAYHQAKLDEGMRWARHARPLIERLDAPDVRGDYERLLGIVHHENGEYGTAVEHLRRSAELLEEAVGPRTTGAAAPLVSLGASLGRTGAYDEAEATLREAISIFEEVLGPRHPSSAIIYSNLSRVHLMQEKEDEAVADVRHALALWQGALRPDHPSIGLGHANLSAVLASINRPHEALEELLKARAIVERAYGEDHRRIAMIYNNEGNLHRRLGDYEHALEAFVVSLERTERGLGPDHPEVALVAGNMCMTLQDLERPADAVPYCERAVEIYDAQPVETRWRAQSHFELAKALVASDKNRHRALELARQSRSEYAELDDAKWVSTLDDWIAELERRSDSGS